MSSKDVIRAPRVPAPPIEEPERREGGAEPTIRPGEGPSGTPGSVPHPHIITPQPSSNPYPGVGVS